MHLDGGWQRLERSIRAWSEKAAGDGGSKPPTLIAPDAVEAFNLLLEAEPSRRQELRATGEDCRRRRVSVFGAPVTLAEGDRFPWHRDWRFDHEWPRRFFKTYDHYGAREVPYDVKYPWELSRLGFLIPIVELHAIEPNSGAARSVIEVVEEWESANPLAYSVNWNPMEASMRAINLVVVREALLLVAPEIRAESAVLLRQVALQGEFVWRTKEYTDVSGNHYAANLAALLIAGLMLRDSYPPAERWVGYAHREIEKECRSQFLPDGVNFEKSVPYHHLVTGLFLLSVVALRRHGVAVAADVEERLHNACGYLAACRRPDGLWPNVGDNDDARPLSFDPVRPGDYSPVLDVGAVLFSDAALKRDSHAPQTAVAWLFGSDGLDRWASMEAIAAASQTWRYFPEGGVVVAAANGNYLWQDVGEVGLRGRGGHGHNDLLSFELVLDGRPVVVDPGCPVYTGDQDTGVFFKSTEQHNGLRIDGEEIAPIHGLFRISDVATPVDVSVGGTAEKVTSRAGHRGYERLAGSPRHVRELSFSVVAGRLVCTDVIECDSEHKAERFLHFETGVEILIDGNRASAVRRDRVEAVIEWNPESRARVEDSRVSHAFGVTEAAEVLILVDHIRGDSRLELRIEPPAA